MYTCIEFHIATNSPSPTTTTHHNGHPHARALRPDPKPDWPMPGRCGRIPNRTGLCWRGREQTNCHRQLQCAMCMCLLLHPLHLQWIGCCIHCICNGCCCIHCKRNGCCCIHCKRNGFEKRQKQAISDTYFLLLHPLQTQWMQ